MTGALVVLEVPQRRRPELLRLVADWWETEAAATATEPKAQPAKQPAGHDSGPSRERIREVFTRSQFTYWPRMLVHLARHPGSWVTSEAISEAIGLAGPRFGGFLGGATKGLAEVDYPYERRYENGRRVYWMDPAVAELVLEVAAESGRGLEAGSVAEGE